MILVLVLSYKVSLVSNGPAVRGSNITFTAMVTDNYSDDELKFVFWDNINKEVFEVSFYLHRL